MDNSKNYFSIDKTTLKNHFTNSFNNIAHNLLSLVKWITISTIVGIVVSGFATLFAYTINLATTTRENNPWLLFFLPLGGILIEAIYTLCGMKKDRGTNLVLSSICHDDNVPLRIAPLIFIGTAITHLFGGSAGREGAALQIGGSIGNALASVIKIDEYDKKVIIMCGMSAAFAAVFGTPMAAAIFSIEVISIGVMYYAALVPCIFSAIIASNFASNMGIHPERFKIDALIDLNVITIAKVIVLALACALVSVIFCKLLHTMPKIYSKLFKNYYIRIIVASILIILINLIFQTNDYQGAGIDVIDKAMNGSAVPYAFLIKILLTTLTIGAGFKGGEIIPSFFIGATLGCTLGNILGISPSLCAALGMIGIFCGVTNCPITSALISFELFGYHAISFFLIIISISYMMSGYSSLYKDQKILYGKTKAKYLN